MDAADLRIKARRCRELLQIAVKQEVKDQLREWAEDFDAEADEIEGRHSSHRLERPPGSG